MSEFLISLLLFSRKNALHRFAHCKSICFCSLFLLTHIFFPSSNRNCSILAYLTSSLLGLFVHNSSSFIHRRVEDMLDDGSKKCLKFPTQPHLNSPSCPHRSPPPQPHRLPRPLPRDCSTLLRRHPTLIWAMMNQMQHRHPVNGKFFPKKKREKFQFEVRFQSRRRRREMFREV